ncbi:pyridoxal phosphate-dependent aminotransferase [Candidatus Palauibacter sp.]|uniref:pyridoxal phosphate-dependent aminotransferase n=1 Tax=Candidatus Palauibacter sp. TaxID=3101350 RepID=UPI003AF1E7B2
MKRRTFLRAGLTGAGVAGIAAAPLAAPLAGATTARGLDTIFNPRRPGVDYNGPVRLSSNENPLGIAPSARQAIIDGLDEANRYPGATGQLVREALVNRLGVTPGQLFFGSGSTEILRIAVAAWAAPGGRLIYAQPTFEDVPDYAQPFPYDHVKVPLTKDYAHDLDRMRAEADKSSAPSVIYFCNPNNPTGTLTPSKDIAAWIRDESEQHLFLVDEAYFELADDPSYETFFPFIEQHPNVMVVRTFSKVYAMAGMRLGYGVAHEATVQRVLPFATQNSPNHVAGVAAVASLADDDFFKESVKTNNDAKAIISDALGQLNIEVLPSQTNFIMHRIKGELATYNERMYEAGFNVGRPFPPMTDWSRLSMGLPSDMEKLAEVMMDFRKKDWI